MAGERVKVSGMASDMATAGPRPGMTPMMTPMMTPSSAATKTAGWMAESIPIPRSVNHSIQYLLYAKDMRDG